MRRPTGLVYLQLSADDLVLVERAVDGLRGSLRWRGLTRRLGQARMWVEAGHALAHRGATGLS